MAFGSIRLHERYGKDRGAARFDASLCIQNSILWCAMLFICNINGERWHEMGVPVYKSPGNIAAKKLSPRNPGTMDRPLIDIFITRAVLAGTAGFLFSGISRFSLTFVRGTSILIT